MNDLPNVVAVGLRDSLLGVAGRDLAAIWLYGAPTFNQPFVDIDLHILLRRQLAGHEWTTIRKAHRRLVQGTCLALDDLDFWYISLEDACGTAGPVHLAPWAGGVRDDHWPLHRAHWLAGRCMVIYGLEPLAVVPQPSWEELETVLRRELRAPRPDAYWTLQACRVWASLSTREVVRSKIDSGNWALDYLARRHQEVVEAAIRCYEQRAHPSDEDLIKAGFPALLTEVQRHVDAL